MASNVFVKFSSEQPQAGSKARVWRFILTSGAVDHDGDRINVSGIDYSVFKANPVALASHAAGELPIGRWSNVQTIGSGFTGHVEADLELAPEGASEAADEAAALIQAGILKGCSIGFRSLKNEPNPHGGFDHLKILLLEASVVSLPANPEALRVKLAAALRRRQAGQLKTARAIARGAGRRLWKVRHDERQRVLTPNELPARIQAHARAAMRKQLYSLTGNLDLAEPEPALGSSGARLPVTQREAAQLVARGVAQAVGDFVRAKSARQS